MIWLAIIYLLVAAGFGYRMYYDIRAPKHYTKWYQKSAALVVCITIGFVWPAFYGAYLCEIGGKQ